jgi:hypothetical protein
MYQVGISRNNVNLIKKKYDAIGKGNVRLTQSNLRLIRTIDPTKSSYTFPVLESETASLLPEEIRLNINDEFVITAMGIYLKGYVEVDNEQIGKIKTTQYYTYSPITLSAGFLKAKALYDGVFRLSVNNINYVENWAVKNHEYVPQYQQWAAAVDATTGLISNEPSTRFMEDAKVALSPMVTLSGAKKNDLTITLPQAIGTPGTTIKDTNGDIITLSINEICISLDGFLAQNASKFQ